MRSTRAPIRGQRASRRGSDGRDAKPRREARLGLAPRDGASARKPPAARGDQPVVAIQTIERSVSGTRVDRGRRPRRFDHLEQNAAFRESALPSAGHVPAARVTRTQAVTIRRRRCANGLTQDFGVAGGRLRCASRLCARAVGTADHRVEHERVPGDRRQRPGRRETAGAERREKRALGRDAARRRRVVRAASHVPAGGRIVRARLDGQRPLARRGQAERERDRRVGRVRRARAARCRRRRGPARRTAPSSSFRRRVSTFPRTGANLQVVARVEQLTAAPRAPGRHERAMREILDARAHAGTPARRAGRGASGSPRARAPAAFRSEGPSGCAPRGRSSPCERVLDLLDEDALAERRGDAACRCAGPLRS